MKVIYLGATDDQIQWGNNADPRPLLKVGGVYEVKRTEGHMWHTKIELVNFPNHLFNDTSFAYVTDYEQPR